MSWFSKKKPVEVPALEDPEAQPPPNKPNPQQYPIRRVFGSYDSGIILIALFEKPNQIVDTARFTATKVQLIDPSEGVEMIFFDYAWKYSPQGYRAMGWDQYVVKVLLHR